MARRFRRFRDRRGAIKSIGRVAQPSSAASFGGVSPPGRNPAGRRANSQARTPALRTVTDSFNRTPTAVKNNSGDSLEQIRKPFPLLDSVGQRMRLCGGGKGRVEPWPETSLVRLRAFPPCRSWNGARKREVCCLVSASAERLSHSSRPSCGTSILSVPLWWLRKA